MIRLVANLLLVTILCSCVWVTPPGESIDAARASLPAVPDTWSGIVEGVGDVKVGWVREIGDSALTNLVEEAQKNNRDLQAVAANLERSWALARQAGAGLLPTVNLTSSADRSGVAEGGSSARYHLGFQAGWELDVWGRIRAADQAAVLSAQSVEADYIFSQNSLAAAVARAYFLAIESHQQVIVIQKTLSTLSETDRIVRVQKEFGLATSRDVALSGSDLARMRASLIAAKGAQRSALRALEVLVGRYPSTELDLRKTLPGVPSLPSAGVPSTLLERRPDIIAAERMVAAAFNRLDQAKVAQMPGVNLMGSIGSTSGNPSGLLSRANIAWQAVTSLAAPLVDGGLRKAQVEQATAEQKQAVAAYGQIALNAFKEVENSLDKNMVLRDRAIALRETVDEANQALRIVRLQYDEGETDLLDVLTIQQRVFTTDADLVSIERQRLDEWVGLNLAIGGSWQDKPRFQ